MTSSPVAAVVVDTGLPHLDREFEYAVPEQLADVALPGVRVRVRFAGRDLDGYVVQRRTEPSHPGRLSPLRTVVSPEQVLTPQVLSVARQVARDHAGVLGDVLRLAVPKRHAAAEKALPLVAEPPPVAAPEPGPWASYPAGRAFLQRVASGQSPAAAWLALPGRPPDQDWPRALAVAAATALAAGRGALVVVPDHRDVRRVEAELRQVVGKAGYVRLTADQGPQARYTAWLKVLRGHVRCVVGTRAAAFAPVADLGLVAWWDDGDDLLVEPRAPYPHVRDVLSVRAGQAGAALLTGGFGRSVEVQQEVEEGRFAAVTAPAATVRRAAARVVVAGDDAEVERDGPAAAAQLPPAAWRAAKAALEVGPVLVQVPRRGYLPSLACQECREPARCPRCHGPMALDARGGAPACRWCGAGLGGAVGGFVCPECGGTRLRSSTTGARRTAEDLGRAFLGVPVKTSGAGQVLDHVDRSPAVVVATPGAEPVAEGGYAAALLLDAWALVERPGLDASVEALRRWLAAGALVRPGEAGGVVVLAGAPRHVTLPAVEALVRWDPAWLAGRELAERRTLRLPPAVTLAQVVGLRAVVAEALGEGSGVDLQAAVPELERLGPLPVRGDAGGPPWRGDAGESSRRDGARASPERAAGAAAPRVQVMLRAPVARREALADALAAVRAQRSARKEPQSVTVRMDPRDL